ncbi:hypothetical protein OTK49_01125 [Vibrio coralliirubri]|uniref:hypothetical protein n=1 Tax=Vibrio coralliirubri TaxID=1516159 RepID=UPI0022834765|nr:hypothetical protein [Vibrio coralliirubri]MCY9861131.1 hypothetical protein [Vibrio coralliirubri]
MQSKIKVTKKEKAALSMMVKQLVTLNLKKPSGDTTQEDINNLISVISQRFHDSFEIID